MDKFNSLAAQAKAKASEASTYAQNKYESRNRSGSASAAHPSPAPSPPPGRAGGPPPPPGRGRASSGLGAVALGAGGGKGVFVGMSQTEKDAFFALLDEYFASRPQFAALFDSGPTAAPAAAPPAAAAPPVAPPRSGPPAPPARGLGTAVALYDFEGQTSEDLAFAEGDHIKVLEHVSEDWWKGERVATGEQGIFPTAYVKMQ